MKPNTEPMLPGIDPTIETIEVQGCDLERAEQRLKAIGAVLLGFSVRGATYTLRVIMPPGEEIERLMEGEASIAPVMNRCATGATPTDARTMNHGNPPVRYPC